MRPEYSRKDLGQGVRGKHYQEYIAAHNLDFGPFCSWATAPRVTPRRCRSVC